MIFTYAGVLFFRLIKACGAPQLVATAVFKVMKEIR